MKKLTIGILILAFIGMLVLPSVLGAVPVISDPKPQPDEMAVALNPVLSVNVSNPENNTMTINFSVLVNGTWRSVRTYNNSLSGNYSAPSAPFMNQPYTQYQWKVTVIDGTDIAEQNFTLTTRGLLKLKYSVVVGADTFKGERQLFPLMADIDADGTQDIVLAAGPNIIALNAQTGQIKWSVPGAEGTAIELVDLDNDGKIETLAGMASSNLRIMAINSNGSIRWISPRISGIHQSMFPLLAYDTNMDGFPEIYFASQDAYPDPYNNNPNDYTGKLTMLDRNGNILRNVSLTKPCWGGLSLADTNNDGRFEIYASDRRDLFHDIPGKGLQAYNADDLTLIWSRPDLQHSSPMAVIADVLGDSNLEIIGVPITLRGPIVINPANGNSIIDYSNRGLPTHTTPTVYDIDNDGHQEILFGTSYPSNAPKNFAVFDLVSGVTKFSPTLGNHTTWAPRIGDVDGDGDMEILVALGEQFDYWSNYPLLVYNNEYKLIDQVDIQNLGQLSEPRVFDVDGDGLNEVVVGGANGRLNVYDTLGVTPTPAPRTWIQEYSYYRTGAPVFYDLPGPAAPLVTNATPMNGSVNVSANPQLKVFVRDYQNERFNVSFQIYHGFTWKQLAKYTNVTNGSFSSNTTPYVTNPETEYKWRVIVTDAKGNSQTYEFMFTTTANITTSKPIVEGISPYNYEPTVSTSPGFLVFSINDTDNMTYNVTTIPDIGSAYAANVPSGQYSVPISGLLSDSDYIWRIEVLGGADITYKEYYFSTPSTLDIVIEGSGTVSANPLPPYARNTVVNLSATPDPGNMFLGWIGNISNYSNDISILLDTSKSVTARFMPENTQLIADGTFDVSLISQELRENAPYQDWYESRNQNPSLLILDENNVGGNTGKKALLSGNTSSNQNVYLTQDFRVPLNESFSVQWDVYVERILNRTTNPDRAAIMLIGDNVPFSNNGPNYQAVRNFAWLAFYKDGGAEDGVADLVTTINNGSEVILASGVSLDAWHTIRVDGDLITDKYDVYLDNILVGSGISARTNKTSVTHISFAQWNDGAGTFYIDNVMETVAPVNITCVDADLDGYNVTGSSCGPIDCNDADIAIYPGATESCDGLDNDCNALTSDGSGTPAPLNANQVGVCSGSLQQCISGSWTDNYAGILSYESSESSCDALDNDCDGSTDESLTQPSLVQDGLCAGNLDVCSAGSWFADAGNYIPAPEICDNGLDEDCNAFADDGCSALNYPGWNYRKKITIDHTKVSADLSGFPVLVSLSDADLASKAQTDGDDILFTASDGSTKLDHEIESYSGGTLVAWIKTDVSSSVDTEIYMYYGNDSASNQENPGDVWDSNYITIHHMEESSGTAADSTGNANDATNINGVSQGVAGKIGNAYSYDGSNDRSTMPKLFTSQTSFTVEAWVNTGSKHGYIVSQRDGVGNGAFLQYYPLEGNFQMYINSLILRVSSTAGSWHYVVGVYNSTTGQLSVDAGTPVSGTAASVTWPDLVTFIGDRSTLGRAFLGSLDEVRISSIARSNDYITTSYNNQNSPSGFYSVSSEES
jgi:hypothetical protein